ncbi:uncharacterized protein V1518DRAFT_158770 [Limtongia smithiae]|uniref:uncharacterized protein n=1 Tax=Limtongia smithiae TaxID=1125753 RepID=UPI0034CE02A0
MQSQHTTSPAPRWTTVRCHRVLRPLSAKLQSLRALLESHPALAQPVSHSGSISPWGTSGTRSALGGMSNGHRNVARANTKYASLQNSRGAGRPKLPSTRGIEQRPPEIQRLQADLLLLSIRDHTPPDLYTCYGSIYHAFHHFMTRSYEVPRTLAQKAAVNIGKCVSYTLDSVPEDEWYDAMDVLDYYKRYIALGHGVSLVARDAPLLKDLLPALIVDCSNFEAYEMGSLLLRSLLETISPDTILTQFDFYCDLSDVVNLSPLILLEYLIPNITLQHLFHPNFMGIFYRLLEHDAYSIYYRGAKLRDLIIYIFALCRRQIRSTSHPLLHQVNIVLLRLATLVCMRTDVFEMSFIMRLLDSIGQASVRFTLAWKLLCIKYTLLRGAPPDEFVDYFHAPSATPSAPFTISARLKSPLTKVFPDLNLHVRPLVENLMPELPKFSVALASFFAAAPAFRRDLELVKWRTELEKRAIETNHLLNTKNWVYDETLEEWVERQPTPMKLEVPRSNENDVVSDDAGSEDMESIATEDDETSNSPTDVASLDEQIGEAVGTQCSPSRSPSSSDDYSDSYIFPPPPPSVMRLTPRSSRRVQARYLKVLSTPATVNSIRQTFGSADVDKQSDSQSEEESSRGIDLTTDLWRGFTQDSPLLGRRNRLVTHSSLPQPHSPKRARISGRLSECTDRGDSRYSAESTNLTQPDVVISDGYDDEDDDEVDELSLTPPATHRVLGDISNRDQNSMENASKPKLKMRMLKRIPFFKRSSGSFLPSDESDEICAF